MGKFKPVNSLFFPRGQISSNLGSSLAYYHCQKEQKEDFENSRTVNALKTKQVFKVTHAVNDE